MFEYSDWVQGHLVYKKKFFSIQNINMCVLYKLSALGMFFPVRTRTKTSIGYANENDREKRKRERKVGDI